MNRVTLFQPTSDLTFEAELFYRLAKTEGTKNFIFSPASIKTCLGLAFMGAAGNTAHEIQQVLRLSNENREAVAQELQELFKDSSNRNGDLKMANRIYVNKTYEISPTFNKLACKYYGATAENVDFKDATQAVNKINQWIEVNTEHKISDLVSPATVDSNTAALLVNAIYFKGNWTHAFKPENTQKKYFHLDETHKSHVDMMSQMTSFAYADLTALNATALEMCYDKYDLKMLIILPKNIEGLTALEEDLKKVNLIKLTEQFSTEQVNLSLPKFKFEYGVGLKPVLEEMGICEMFLPNANFSNLLSQQMPLTVSDARHKAFIEVNEFGTEAAAATSVTFRKKTSTGKYYENIYEFVVDHPFFFAITDDKNVYFAGHVVNI